MPLNYDRGVQGDKHKINMPNVKSEEKADSKTKPIKNNNIQYFPVSPKYDLRDMIISEETYDQITTVIQAEECWNQVFVAWGLSEVMGDRRNLFVNLYGAPGTGKTMAAHAIAKALNKSMVCVNYAEIESKYVGETSKNLTALFEQAKSLNAVIFFDEADAFLSKRVTNMSNSTDVSVNQTRSVLLTLLNDYKGIVIFATNFITNYDSAFMRRIQYHIKFDLPDVNMRKMLWQRYIPRRMPTDVNISEIAEKYSDISGSDISTAVLKAALKAAKRNENIVRTKYFEEAIGSIISSKFENSNCTVMKRYVSEEYALKQIRKGE